MHVKLFTLDLENCFENFYFDITKFFDVLVISTKQLSARRWRHCRNSRMKQCIIHVFTDVKLINVLDKHISMITIVIILQQRTHCFDVLRQVFKTTKYRTLSECFQFLQSIWSVLDWWLWLECTHTGSTHCILLTLSLSSSSVFLPRRERLTLTWGHPWWL